LYDDDNDQRVIMTDERGPWLFHGMCLDAQHLQSGLTPYPLLSLVKGSAVLGKEIPFEVS
jgi:hypothetical protein